VIYAYQPFQRTPNNQNASWFLDLHESGKLDLNPRYQRRSVWNLEYKQFFIDSVIRNYPTQAIFLDQTVDPDEPTRYRVLDGKQRLTSLIEFYQNEFMTPDSLEDLDLGNVYYSDLPKPVRASILKYLFTVETVSDTSNAELNQAFDRLNRNVSKLNKQELRHAQYDGAFASKMERFAEDRFWELVGFSTPARRRRMLDVEYVAELYIVCMSGVQDGKNYLDRAYSEYDDEIPLEQKVDARFASTQKALLELHEILPLTQTRFVNVADFYSLWAALTTMIDEVGQPRISIDAMAAALGDFQVEIDEQKSPRSSVYLLAARQGSNKGSNRLLRAQVLAAALAGDSGIEVNEDHFNVLLPRNGDNLAGGDGEEEEEE
jgi:hypothetical protein